MICRRMRDVIHTAVWTIKKKEKKNGEKDRRTKIMPKLLISQYYFMYFILISISDIYVYSLAYPSFRQYGTDLILVLKLEYAKWQKNNTVIYGHRSK